MRHKIDYITTSPKAYEKFKEDSDLKIEKKVWKKVIEQFNTLMVEHMIESGETVNVIHGLGDMRVEKRKIKPRDVVINGKKVRTGMPIDWFETKRQGKVVYHKNYHTDGYKCNFYWSPYSARFTNAICWKFKAARLASRYLASKLKSPNAGYLLDKYKDVIKK